jgi:hypothetical protein
MEYSALTITPEAGGEAALGSMALKMINNEIAVYEARINMASAVKGNFSSIGKRCCYKGANLKLAGSLRHGENCLFGGQNSCGTRKN